MLSIVSFIWMLTGCSFPKPKFGLDSNVYRQKIGLEILLKNWSPISTGETFTIWRAPENLIDKGNAIFFSKTVRYTKNYQLESEEDIYYSGKKFETVDGMLSENLVIKYYFLPGKEKGNEVLGWYCEYQEFTLSQEQPYKAQKNYILNINTVTLDSADSLLRQWGLSPPIRKVK